jgi:hypothetical protein
MGVRGLADAAKVSTDTITRFERAKNSCLGRSMPSAGCSKMPGGKFINAGKSGGPGVRLQE